MSLHTTNYKNTFIEIAEDCPVAEGQIPPLKGDQPSVATLQYELVIKNPYVYTSDDIFFKVHAVRKDISEIDFDLERNFYFSKGQPCFRASPLTKRYGWGVHSDANGKVAIYGCETEAYEKFCQDPNIRKVKAMKSKR